MLPQNSTTTTQMGFSQDDIEIGDLDLVDLPDLDENFEIPDFEEFSSEIEEEENENLTQQQQISNSKLPTRTIPDQIVSPPELVKIPQPKQQSVQQKRPTEINSDVDTVSLNMQNVPFYRKEASNIFGNFYPYLEAEGSVYRKIFCKNIDYSFWGGQCRPAIIKYYKKLIGWIFSFVKKCLKSCLNSFISMKLSFYPWFL